MAASRVRISGAHAKSNAKGKTVNEYQSLTRDENDLIRVAKYFHSNQGEFEKLVVKLSKHLGFSNSSIADMTGISPQSVAGIVRRKGFMAELLPKQAKVNRVNDPGPSKKTTETVEEDENPRLTIHVDANSGLANRVAYDASKHIESELRSGDQWLSLKEMMKKFDCGNRTAVEVNKILVNHNWIERAGTNRSDGYKVK